MSSLLSKDSLVCELEEVWIKLPTLQLLDELIKAQADWSVTVLDQYSSDIAGQL